MQWPIYFREQLILGDEKSPVAICTLWSIKESVAGKMDRNSYSLIGNLYTMDGINYMIRNVLAHPWIKHIILVGADLMHTGEALLSLTRDGITEDYRIKNANAFVHRAIGIESVERFRKYVVVHDLRQEKGVDSLKLLVGNLNSSVTRAPFAEPEIITAEEKPAEGLDHEDVAFRISGHGIANVWLRALDVTMKFGEVKETEYKMQQKEILDLVSVIEDDNGALPNWLPINSEDLKNYVDAFFSASKPENVDYTYGERLFAFALPEVGEKSKDELQGIINQVEIIKQKLKKNPFTRRAIAVTWRHEKDFSSDNPPCLIEIVWNMKNGRLNQTATFRSHDVFGAWLLNAYGLRELQKEVAGSVGVDVGVLVIVSVSAHVYRNNWANAEELVNRLYAGKREPVEIDPRGYFLITVDKKEKVVVVRHKLNDTRDSKYTFRGKSAEELYRKIVHENLISKFDHASYMGKELARAEAALKSGKEFVQDAAETQKLA